MDAKQLEEYLKKAKEPNHHDTTKILWQGKEYPLLQRHSVNVLADKVLHGLEANQYQNLVVCGKSGTGKTTFVQNLLHNMVCKREQKQFMIKWHKRDEIHNLDKIVKAIPKGVPSILILDDVSYELDELSPLRRKEIFKVMTTIRHEVKSQILVVFITHYSRSLQKYLRSDADFTVLLSLSSSELDNWIDIMGQQSKWRLNIFQKQYAHSMSKGSFIVNSDNGHPYIYGTNKPFRIALCNEYGVDIHSVLFTSESCAKCSLNPSNREVINTEEFLTNFKHSYPNCYSQVLQWYSFMLFGKKENTISAEKRQAWNFLQKILEKNDLDFDEILTQVGKRKRRHLTKQIRADQANAIKDMIQGTKLSKNESRILDGIEGLLGA
jgi:DNA polymerase III delta prime subunit